MKWKQLTCSDKFHHEITSTGHLKRIENPDNFDIDFRKIVHSASFRRLQDKTQVFPLEKNDFVRTRLTHSLEVSAIASTIGSLILKHFQENNMLDKDELEALKSIPEILRCAGLIHDLGNPPFGHYAENVIQTWFNIKCHKTSRGYGYLTRHGDVFELSEANYYDFINFDGNAHTFRIINSLHYEQGYQGMNLSISIIGAIQKYMISSSDLLEVKNREPKIYEKKLGYFTEDYIMFKKVGKTLGVIEVDKSNKEEGITKISRNPLAFIIEAADDIAYKIADLEDTYKKGLIHLNDLIEFLEIECNLLINKNTPNKYDYAIDSLMKLKFLKEDRDINGKCITDYDLVSQWLFEIQNHLINAAKYAFTSNYKKIMEGNYDNDLIKGTNHESTMEILAKFCVKYAFESYDVSILELKSQTVIEFLLEEFIEACLYYNNPNVSKIDYKHKYKKIWLIISENYKNSYLSASQSMCRYKGDSIDNALRIHLALDAIAGMTDSYALQLYESLIGKL